MTNLTVNRASSELCSGIRDGYTLLDLARGWLQQGNPIIAKELLSSAVVSVEADTDPELRAKTLKETGRALMMESDWDGAEMHYLEAQRVFRDISNLKGAAECARNRANLNFQKGNYGVSAELCEQALGWASELNDYELRATVLNTLGAIKSATGNHPEAIKVFKLCLADFESSNNKIRQGYVLLNIGLAQTELGDHAQAISSLEQALAIAMEIRDLYLVEVCYQNISKCYLEQHETNLARSVLETARKILPGLNSKALEAELYLIDAKILRVSGNPEAAELLLQKTYNMALEHDLTALQADVLYEQGLLERKRGNLTLATCRFDAAVNQYKQLGMEKGYRKAVQALEQVERKQDA